MSTTEPEPTSDLLKNNQRVSSKQRIFIGITKAGSDMFGILFAGALLGFYVDILHMDPTNYGTVLIIFAI
ncbi:unnamed protein product [marine sediment metagenome]|uniref:Uncharacterized protein n=1 Tax=marine sediment metagenome TaxID=412755 RepID=X1CZL1_9ZZZZ